MDNYVTQYNLELKKYDYFVHFESRAGHTDGGVFVAIVPKIGARAEGSTIKSAISRVTDVANREIISFTNLGKELPESDPTSKHQIYINAKVARKVKLGN